LREPDARREVAIAFLHGFLLGKSGAATFNPQNMAKQSNAFIEHCRENPARQSRQCNAENEGLSDAVSHHAS
jgi:hypothetical protein